MSNSVEDLFNETEDTEELVKPSKSSKPVKSVEKKKSSRLTEDFSLDSAYKIVVRGEYYGNIPNVSGKARIPFEEVVHLDTMDAALSKIRGKVLPYILRAKYPDFSGIRTCVIKDVEAPKNGAEFPLVDKNISRMSRDQLKQFVRIHMIDEVDIDSYDDLSDAQFGLLSYLDNPERYLETNSKRLEDRKDLQKLRELNPSMG